MALVASFALTINMPFTLYIPYVLALLGELRWLRISLSPNHCSFSLLTLPAQLILEQITNTISLRRLLVTSLLMIGNELTTLLKGTNQEKHRGMSKRGTLTIQNHAAFDAHPRLQAAFKTFP